VLIPSENWDAPALATQIQAILGNPEEMRKLRRRASAWGKPQAAAELVRACEQPVAVAGCGALRD
jgi:UDP-N-acetylglucosamine:LPS N-acetylglucosamine transferase